MRRLVAVVGVVAVLLGVGFLAVQFGSGPIVARYLEARLEEETGYPWTLALRAGVTLGPGLGLVLSDVDARVDLDRDAVARVQIPTARLFGAITDWGQRARLDRVELDGPSLQLPRELWRYLRHQASDRPSRPEAAMAPGRVVVRDASIRLTAEGAAPQHAVRDLDLEAEPEARGRPLTLKARGRFGGEEFRSELALEGMSGAGSAPVLVRFTFELPRLLASPVTGGAEAVAEGRVVTVSRLAGSAGPHRFSGALVFDGTAKPAFRLDLGFPTLAFGPGAGAASSGESAGWTLTPEGLEALRDFDARLKLYVGTLEIGAVSVTEVSGQAQVKDGAVALSLLRASLYGGDAQGSFALTPGGPAPAHAVQVRVKDSRALPFLTSMADFTLLDGKVSASVDVRGTGWSSTDLVRTLSGTADVEAREGRLNNVNLSLLAQMVSGRAPVSADQGSSGATAFDRFSARFRLADGRATTSDMVLRGPVVEATGSGVVDVPERTLAFRVNPRLNAGTSPVTALMAGLSIPVVVEGPWASPRAYPDFGGRSGGAAAGPAPAPDALGGLLGKGGLGALLDAIVPNSPPQRDCGRNCPGGDEGLFGPRRPGTGSPGRP